MTVLSKLYTTLLEAKSLSVNRYVLIVGVSTACWTLLWYKLQERKEDSRRKVLAIGTDKQKHEWSEDDSDQGLLKIDRLLGIAVPGILSVESGLLLLLTGLLGLRTYLDIWVLHTTTSIESSIINRNKSRFGENMIKVMFAAPGLSLVNNLIKYCTYEAQVKFRENLTRYFYDKYMSGRAYYKLANLDTRITNPDQLIAETIGDFSDTIAEFFSNIIKPLADLLIYVATLSGSIGIKGLLMMVLYMVTAGTISAVIQQPVVEQMVESDRREGDFRTLNMRLVANSEQVAFYGGERKETSTLHRYFRGLCAFSRKQNLLYAVTGFMEKILSSYTSTLVGYYILSRPFFDEGNAEFMSKTRVQLLESYYVSGQKLIRMSGAFLRLTEVASEMKNLAAQTCRLLELDNVLDDFKRQRYTMSSNPEAQERLRESLAAVLTEKGEEAAGESTVVIDDDGTVGIKFEEVPIITPGGETLLSALNLEIKAGTNVVFCGPNGSGKTSLFRILSGLWPTYAGTLTKPPAGQIIYIPQKPYMTVGTLRDQLIYPDTLEDMKEQKVSDADLKDILATVQLSNILERECGWEAEEDWIDILSGGEKQRLAMARVFYRRPKFVILDECTSNVSVDVETALYSRCKELGITMLTVSHKRSLWAYHEYYCKLDGKGGYEFGRVMEMSLDEGSEGVPEEVDLSPSRDS